jgi:hypothetical protein
MLHLVKLIQSLMLLPTFHMCIYDNIPRDDIRWRHLVEHFQSLLHPCSHIWHVCGRGYSLWLLTHNHFEWSLHEPTCPLQVPIHYHTQLTPPQKWFNLATNLHVCMCQKCVTRCTDTVSSLLESYDIGTCEMWEMMKGIGCISFCHVACISYVPIS